MKVLRAFFRLLANHCPEPHIRHFLFRHSGLQIGKKTFINMGLHAVDDYIPNMIIIKDRVAIAPNASIVSSSWPNNSKLNDFIKPVHQKVTIDDDVWIGAGVVIMPGVTIGKLSVLGSNCVIVRDVEPYSIMAGVPAKRIGDIRDKKGV